MGLNLKNIGVNINDDAPIQANEGLLKGQLTEQSRLLGVLRMVIAEKQVKCHRFERNTPDTGGLKTHMLKHRSIHSSTTGIVLYILAYTKKQRAV